MKDRITNRPVIVEFKFTPFYRENIGQILEYKARIVSILNNEESDLFKIFGSYVFVPILVLIVKECDDFSRVACNMSGIEVYEFKNFSNTINNPEDLEYPDVVPLVTGEDDEEDQLRNQRRDLMDIQING